MLDQLGLRANVNFVFASNMMSDTSAKLQKIVGVMYSVAGVFWLVAALVMFVVYFFAFNERQKNSPRCARSVPRRRRVIGIVLGESTMLSTIGGRRRDFLRLHCREFLLGVDFEDDRAAVPCA